MAKDKTITAPGMAGKRHSEESKAQMSAAHKAQWARYHAEQERISRQATRQRRKAEGAKTQ
jgi:NUMOD3 motif